jgi:hypothetical protein
VTDGVTIGRPTCSVHDCDIPLKSVKNRYCPVHQEQDLLCAVTTCSERAEEGHRTCNIRDHRELEDYNTTQNKAMFQLKHRLARLKASQPRDSMPEIPAKGDAAPEPVFDDEEVTIDSTGVCDGKPEEGNRTLRARFGRKRTHNEELCVASCGVILGRATFYGSEAPNGVRASEFFCYAITVYSLSLSRPFGRHSFQHGGRFRVSFGTTTIAALWPCSREKTTPISQLQHFQLTFFILSASTRQMMTSAMHRATQPDGQSFAHQMGSGGSIHQLLSRQTRGLVDTRQLCARCRLIGIKFSWMN